MHSNRTGECNAMYSGMPGLGHMLPCGHKASQTFFTKEETFYL